MKKILGAALLVAVAVVLGFFIGLAIGKETREAAPGRASVKTGDGKITVVFDAVGAIGDGIKSAISKYL